MNAKLVHHLPWLAGFFLSVNLYLVPQVASSPRLTDLAGFVLFWWVMLHLARGKIITPTLIILGLTSLMPLTWLFFGVLEGDPASVVQSARWLLAVPWALAMMLILDQEDRSHRFAWGIIVGGWVNVAVILLQVLGWESQLRLIGLSSSGAAFHHHVAQAVRIPGLHGQHNASSSVISLVVPAGMYLYFRGRCSILVLLATLTGLAVALHLTSTRSPLVITVLTFLFAAAMARKFSRVVIIGIVLFSVLVPLVTVYGPPGGWSRWRDTQAANSNARERVETNIGALDIAIDHPFGVGVKQGQALLADRTAIQATHNAFLQVSLHFGLLLGLIVFTAMVRGVSRGLGGVEHPLFLVALAAFHSAGLFLFEEHLNNPTFIILTTWFIATMTWRRGVEASGHGSPERSVTGGLS